MVVSSDRIRVVGAFMKGKARDWYDNRARQLRSNRKTDTLSAFVSAMYERLTTSHEADLAYAEMHKFEDQGSVMTYVDKFIGLDEKAHMTGRSWRTVLVNGLPEELGMDLAKLRGGKPKEDDALRLSSKRLALLPKSFPEMKNSRTRAQRQPPLQKAMGIANASGSQRRQTQL